MGSCQNLSHSSAIPESVYQALFHFDSRATSLLLKDLSKAGLGYRAVEMFDWLRALDASHPLRHLCDVYTYTAMISLCIYNQVPSRMSSHASCKCAPVRADSVVASKHSELPGTNGQSFHMTAVCS